MFVYRVAIQQNLLITEAALVPGLCMDLLPVVPELLHVVLDGDVMTGPGVAPQAGQAHQSVAQPALVGAALSHVVTEPLLLLLHQSCLLLVSLVGAWRLFSLSNLTQYF